METLLKKLAQTLTQQNLKIVTAESCTGGLVASYLTELPGSSAFFECGFVTYSPESKQTLLGVPSEVIEQFGIVSEETAAAMALGALKQNEADISISTTGIAGPNGGSFEIPVGTVCFGIAKREGIVTTYTKVFSGDREAVREQAVEFALEILKKLLNSPPEEGWQRS